LIIGDALMQF